MGSVEIVLQSLFSSRAVWWNGVLRWQGKTKWWGGGLSMCMYKFSPPSGM